jgi:putative PIN family toxin of toxin-antitoxin system
MRVVIDTNVIVSALININGTPAKILSSILNDKIKILYDNRIIFEYIDVLSRKEFGFPKEIVNDMIDYFKHDGEYINSEYMNTEFFDEADKKFYEVYKSGKAQYLITGNIKHFPKEDTIIIPKDFMQIYEK